MLSYVNVIEIHYIYACLKHVDPSKNNCAFCPSLLGLPRMFRLVAVMRDARSVSAAVQPFTRTDFMGSFEVPNLDELKKYQVQQGFWTAGWFFGVLLVVFACRSGHSGGCHNLVALIVVAAAVVGSDGCCGDGGGGGRSSLQVVVCTCTTASYLRSRLPKDREGLSGFIVSFFGQSLPRIHLIWPYMTIDKYLPI